MNKILFLILIQVLFVSSRADAQKIDKCALIDSILGIEKVHQDLVKPYRTMPRIRLIDFSGFFQKTDCVFDGYVPITVWKKVPFDANIGYFIDIFVLSAKKRKGEIKFTLTYVVRSQDCKSNGFYFWDIIFTKIGNNYHLKSTQVSQPQFTVSQD